MAASQIAAFIVAATGAAFALYYLLPPILAEPGLKRSVARFAIILLGAFVIVVLLSRLKRR